MTNRANTVNIEDLDSDHQAVMTIRKMNIIPAEEQYIKVRDMNKIKDHNMNEKVIGNMKYWNTFEIEEPNEIAGNILKIVQESFGPIKPVKKIKMNDSERPIKDKDMEKLIDIRNAKYKEMKINNNSTIQSKWKQFH